MGSNLNFKNFEQMPMDGNGCGGFSFPLTRQSSVYSLTLDEFQSAVGATGKDFGSMNMDELLKNIWSAEENQNIGSTSGLSTGGQEMGGSFHRQGSLLLPRTLSLKTVDDVWKDMSKEYIEGTDRSGGINGFSMSQRQPTLGQMTLEEFLMRAGAVRESTGSRLDGNSNIVVSLNDLTPPLSSNMEFGFGYQQAANAIGGLISGGGIGESSIQMASQSGNLPLSVNGVRSSAYEFGNQQQQQLLPKQPALAYTAQMAVPSNSQLSSPGMGGGIIGITDPSTVIQNTTLQGGGLGIFGLGANNVNIETGSPAVSTDGLTKVNGDVSSTSPVPYVFNGGFRGRKVAAVEKIVERRHRRMIKNRESAARSRARKQAYTMELEAEVAKLKEENQELEKKQAKMIEIQKNQVLEMTKQQKNGSKRRCLRRTCTGPW
ncbi:ABSCISIC ACID-INSENSITIVE 5-like protein 5 isoform X1 [Primulina tabacum]|uniref:ABSCISIC ACID-INSENSITIVE 5-like protein 5 isoform X1 n=2 Tax=Primulina tabacum TaxID=48773 RepID=UPI003F5A7669